MRTVVRRPVAGVLALAALLAGIVAFGAGPSSGAHSRPTCLGRTATIVGTNGSNRISGTRGKDVIAALGGNDVIEAKGHRADHGNDIVCGGTGNDKIVGNAFEEKLVGGPGNDVITAGNGNDLVVGDNANLSGNETGRTGTDDLAGAGGRDF